MKIEKTKQEKVLDTVCWVVIGAAALYFGFQIAMGLIFWLWE